jgi:hypothetical protein
MARTVYVDISAKLEEWTADSVVAMTNGGEIIPSPEQYFRIDNEAGEWSP